MTWLPVAGLALCLAACADPIPNHEMWVTERIDRQELARDKCLADYVASHDDSVSDATAIGRRASAACSAQDQKLIELLLQMIHDEDAHVATVVLNESIQKGTSFVLRRRAEAAAPK